MMKRFALALIVIVSIQAKGQQIIQSVAPTVCYAGTQNRFTTIGPPKEYLQKLKQQGSARSQSTNIEVDYEGFSQEARDAFQAAVDIWESLLVSPVKIRIHARWTPLATGVLGMAGPGQYIYNFPGAPKQGVWYPIALAEKIAGKELNAATDYDIDAAFNSANSGWWFGLNGNNPPAAKYDMMSIVLHEIGHGLGISHAYDVQASLAVIPTFFEGKPVAYETYIETSGHLNYVNDFSPPSAALRQAITGKNLYFNSDLVRSVNGGIPGVLYAPVTYASGSSIAHLDEATYPAGDPNSLMTPVFDAAERMLDPGPVGLAILKEIGWEFTSLDHNPLKDTENTTGPYHAIVKVRSDIGYDPNSLKITYWNTNNPAAKTTVKMNPTANANEFAFDIPGGNASYSYLISVKDNNNKSFSIPSLIVKPGSQPAGGQYDFYAGPDVTPPVIDHHPKQLVTNIDDFIVEAEVSDNIAVGNVVLQWKLNGVAKADKPMSYLAGTISTYETIIDKSNYKLGDVIEYRIRAQDVSAAHNVNFNPSPTEFYKVTISGFAETRNSYENHFIDSNSVNDFFGNGFHFETFTQGDGFITTDHPYPSGGSSNQTIDLIYNLKYPIRVAKKEATVVFDEIVLIEPGEDASVWPNRDFYDYVVVEGSADGGQNWVALTDGYDSRYNTDWLNTWNSKNDGTNSTAVGNASLFRNHTFNILSKFKAGDEVAIRFRLYSDEFTAGWGWAIANLKIQIDEAPPVIEHQHFDYALDSTSTLTLKMKVGDAHGVEDIYVDYKVNNGTTMIAEVIVNPATDMYSAKFDIKALKAGDVFQYRIGARDSLGHEGTYPPDRFISVAIISSESPMEKLAILANNNGVVAGNFFNVDNNVVESDHPYRTGFGVNGTDFTWLIKKAFTVNSENSKITYDDIALVEYNGSNVKDYVVVEGSKDGIVWEQLIAPYAANANDTWKTAYNNGGAPGNAQFVSHTIDITATNKFKAGDVVFIRFRLHSDSVNTGYGWVVRGLNVQGAITGLEPTANDVVTVWPNPVAGNFFYVKLSLPQGSEVTVEIINTQGQILHADQFPAPSGEFQRQYDVSNWASGLYIVRAKSVFGTYVTKLIKLK